MGLLTAIHGNNDASIPPSKVTLPTFARSCRGQTYTGLPGVQYVGALTSGIADAIEAGGISVTISPFVEADGTSRTSWKSNRSPSSATSRSAFPAIYALDSSYNADPNHILVLGGLTY